MAGRAEDDSLIPAHRLPPVLTAPINSSHPAQSLTLHKSIQSAPPNQSKPAHSLSEQPALPTSSPPPSLPPPSQPPHHTQSARTTDEFSTPTSPSVLNSAPNPQPSPAHPQTSSALIQSDSPMRKARARYVNRSSHATHVFPRNFSTNLSAFLSIRLQSRIRNVATSRCHV